MTYKSEASGFLESDISNIFCILLGCPPGSDSSMSLNIHSKAEMDAVMSQKKVPFQEVHNKFVKTSLQVHLPKKHNNFSWTLHMF